MKKIGIFGIGAIGSVLTKYLIRNIDNEYFFFNRTKHTSITIEHNQEEVKIALHFSDVLDGELDWLIVCLKEYQVKEVISDIQNLMGDSTKLVIFQNGINLSEPYTEITTKDKMLETIIDCPIERITRTHFRQTRNPLITLPENQLANEFIQLFDKEEVKFNKTPDFRKAQWFKLIESSAIGAIQSVTNKPCSIFQESKYVEKYESLVKEGIQVARSEGIHLDDELSTVLVTKLLDYPQSKGSSMLTDKLRGQVLELDAKIGAIIKMAYKNKISVPNSNRYYKSLLHYNNSTSEFIS